MRKIIFSVILILFTVSCATLMEETWTVATPEGAVTVRHYDPTLDLLLGLYISSLIAAPPRIHNYNYLPTWKDVLYEQDLDHALIDYEYKLRSINRMETWKLEMEVQRLMDDLKRAKED